MAALLDLIRSEAALQGWTPTRLAAEAGVSYDSAWRALRGGDWRGEESLSAMLVALGLVEAPGVSDDSDSR